MATTKEVILITGANTGLGFEIAKKLLHDHGDRFYVLLGCRNMEKGNAALKSLKEHGLTGFEVLHVENTDIESVQHAAKTVDQKFGRLDVLHANAGIAPDKDKDALYPTILSAMGTNVAGTAQLVTAFSALLSAAPNPRVIMMSSGLGSLGWNSQTPGRHAAWPAYACSKAATNMLMLWFAQQHPEWRVNACCPGFRATALNNFGESALTQKIVPGKLEDGAVNAVRLTLLAKDGETGTFTQRDDVTGEIKTLPW